VNENLIQQVDDLIDEIKEIVHQVQNERFETGFSTRRESPVVFKELPIRSEVYENLSQALKKMASERSILFLYRKRIGLLLLLSAFLMVRYDPFGGGFWETFFNRMNLLSFRQGQLFEWMWRAFVGTANDNWFKKPVISWDKRRLLVHSIYRESKSISFSQIQSFFIRYYTAYDDMRAFDFEYDRWDPHPFGNQKEKEENRFLIRDTLERLISIFNFIEDSDLAFKDVSAKQLVEAIRKHTGIDPLSMFSDASRLSDLILKIFQRIVTLSQFERYLTNKKPTIIKPAWLDGKSVSWNKLLKGSITYGVYKIDNRVFEVVPKIGLRLAEMVEWPYDRFFDPTNLFLKPKDIESDTVAIRRRDSFSISSEGWHKTDFSIPFFVDNSLQGYVWIGKRRIGQYIKAGDVKCPVRMGINFLASLKYDPQTFSLKVMISYVDFYNPEERYKSIAIILNETVTIWEGFTDHSGRRNSEIYESAPLDPNSIPGQLTVHVEVNNHLVGFPQIIAIDAHSLISRYSNSIVSPGRNKFGETRFVLITELAKEEIELSDSVSIKKELQQYGNYNQYEIIWNNLHVPFRLKAGDVEWNFEQAQDIYFVSKFLYVDDLFEISPEIAQFTTKNPEGVQFDLHMNISPERLDLFDFNFSKDGKEIKNGKLPNLLELTEIDPHGVYRLDHKTFTSLQEDKKMTPGSYCLQINMGRPGSRTFISKELRFFIMPDLELRPIEDIYLEGEKASIKIQSGFPCFWDENSSKFVKNCLIDLGVVNLDRVYEQNGLVTLNSPSISATFTYKPTIFACRFNSKALDSIIQVELLMEESITVYGLANEELIVVIQNDSKNARFNSFGRVNLDYMFFKSELRSAQTDIELWNGEKKICFEIWWLPAISKLSLTDEKSTHGKIISNEASFQINIDGPPDGKVLLRLINNLGETCGEKVIQGSGVHNSCVVWQEEVTDTNTAVLKAFIQNPEGAFLPAPGAELSYMALSPEKELAFCLKKIDEKPESATSWFHAAIVAHKHNLAKPEKIVNWLDKAVDIGLHRNNQLERAVDIYYSLGFFEQAENADLAILRSYKATITACIKYFDIAVAKSVWDGNTDDLFRSLIDKASRIGMKDHERAFYLACRSLKKDNCDEALNQLYTVQVISANYTNRASCLIEVSLFKLGEFKEILRTQNKHRSAIRNWALWISEPDNLEYLKSDIELPDIQWNFLSKAEREVLNLFNGIETKKSSHAISQMCQCSDCVPGLLSKWAAYSFLKEKESAIENYRKLVSINSKFEREIKPYGNRT